MGNNNPQLETTEMRIDFYLIRGGVETASDGTMRHTGECMGCTLLRLR